MLSLAAVCLSAQDFVLHKTVVAPSCSLRKISTRYPASVQPYILIRAFTYAPLLRFSPSSPLCALLSRYRSPRLTPLSMSQGAFFTFGFFALAHGKRSQVKKPPPSPSKKQAASSASSASSVSSPPSSTWFNFYATTIQRPNDPVGLSAEVRIYSPPNDNPLLDNTIAFIVAKAYIPDAGPILLDAIALYPIPGDPASDEYEDRVPDMLYPFVYGLGTSLGKAETLADGKSKGFTVKLTERVRDGQQTSSVQYVMLSLLQSPRSPSYALLCSCVIDGQSPRWVNVPPPSANSLVSFLGICSDIRPGRKLSLAMEMLVYNPSPAPPSTPIAPSPEPTPPTPSGKRRKFVAVHAPSSPIAGPSTYVFFSTSTLSTSTHV